MAAFQLIQETRELTLAASILYLTALLCISAAFLINSSRSSSKCLNLRSRVTKTGGSRAKRHSRQAMGNHISSLRVV